MEASDDEFFLSRVTEDYDQLFGLYALKPNDWLMVDWRSGNALVSGAQAVACNNAHVRAKDRGFDPHIHRSFCTFLSNIEGAYVPIYRLHTS